MDATFFITSLMLTPSFSVLLISLFKPLQGSALHLNTASLFHTVHDSFTLTHQLNLSAIQSTALLIPTLLPFHGCAYCLSSTHSDLHYCWPYSISPSYIYALLDQQQQLLFSRIIDLVYTCTNTVVVYKGQSHHQRSSVKFSWSFYCKPVQQDRFDPILLLTLQPCLWPFSGQ